MNGSGRVLVTGANGHVGNNLVKALLAHGYRVRASVRDAYDADKTRALPTHDIELVSLDVRDQEAFVRASTGVNILFHVAATYKYHTGHRSEAQEMERDAVEGARAAVMAAAYNRIPRLVLTSSVVTLALAPKGGPPATEDDWRTDLREPYQRAKTLAEQEAWRLAREHGVDMVTVLPGAILGPGFHRRTASTNFVEAIMLGSMRMGAPNVDLPVVDIRDVVEGHILAAESGAGGRFILCNDTCPSMFELAALMHEIDPSIPAAPRLLPDEVAMPLAAVFDWLNHKLLHAPRTMDAELAATVKGRTWAASNERAKRELGWRPTVPLRQSLADTIATLRALRAREAARETATAGA